MLKSSKLSWITVTNIKKAKEFYVNVLGLTLLEENKEYPWLEVAPEDKSYILGIMEKNDHGGKVGVNSIMTFNVKNIIESKKYFENKGVVFTDKIMEVAGHVKIVTFTDEDGNKFQLVENI